MPPAVRLHEAVALAGRFPLLAGACLEVGEGEVVHLRGPNGAGKTSLLKVLAGLLAVHSGEATVLGWDLVADRRAVRREVGMLGHQSFLYEELTVEENLRFARASGQRLLSRGPPRARAVRFRGSPRVHSRRTVLRRTAAPRLACGARRARCRVCGCSTSRMRDSTRTAVIFSTSSSPGPGRLAALSCSPRTSSSEPRPSPTGRRSPGGWPRGRAARAADTARACRDMHEPVKEAPAHVA